MQTKTNPNAARDAGQTEKKKEARIGYALKQIAISATDCTILKSINYGDVEAWNLVCCYLDNAETEGNPVLAHIQGTICYESDDVQAYFRKLGINF